MLLLKHILSFVSYVSYHIYTNYLDLSASIFFVIVISDFKFFLLLVSGFTASSFPSFTPNHCIFYLNDLISSGSGLCLPFQNHRGTVLQCPTSKLIGHKLHLLMKPHIVETYFSPSLPSSLHPSLPLSLSLSLALCPLIIFKMPLPI